MTEPNVDAVRRARDALDRQPVPFNWDTMVWCSFCGRASQACKLPCCLDYARAFAGPQC